MRRCPQSQEECEQKRKTPKEKDGDVRRTTWGFENGVEKKTGKDGKTLRAAAARPFLTGTRNPRKKTAPLRTPRAPNLRVQRTHCEKNAFQNELSSAAPGVFWPLKPNFDKISNMEPYKIVTYGKIILKRGPLNFAMSTRQKGSKRYRDAKWLRNPLFCSVSRVSTSTDVLAEDSRPKLTKKGLPGRVAKKTRKMPPKGPFCKKVNFAFFPSSPQFREKRSPHFAL